MMIKNKLWLNLSLLLMLLSILSGVNANPPPPYYQGDIEIRVLNEDNRPFQQYSTSSRYGNTRAFLQAEKNRLYKIEVKNRSNKRIGIVVAVDGRNIISGKKSWLRNDERMYILKPYEKGTYKGWRTGRDKVNRFYFTYSDDSYADAWGDNSAMGVISVAVYREKPYQPPPQYWSDREARPGTSGRPGSPSARADEAGTGFGHAEYSPSVQVEFQPEAHTNGKYFLKYEWYQTLCDRKVLECYNSGDYYHRGKGSEDFPDRGNGRNRMWDEDYAPPPPGHRGRYQPRHDPED